MILYSSADLQKFLFIILCESFKEASFNFVFFENVFAITLQTSSLHFSLIVENAKRKQDV